MPRLSPVRAGARPLHLMNKFQHIAFTPDVLAAQRTAYGRTYPVTADPGTATLGPEEIAFVEARDSFYMASVSADGWPYVQHRGGPAGFLVALDPRTLAFADLRGNRQLITVGNLAGDDRVALILVDYPNRARLKIFARAEVVSANSVAELLARLAPRGETGSVERLIQLHVVGYDWNCPQHITQRFTQAEVDAYVSGLRLRNRPATPST